MANIGIIKSIYNRIDFRPPGSWRDKIFQIFPPAFQAPEETPYHCGFVSHSLRPINMLESARNILVWPAQQESTENILDFLLDHP